MGDAKRRKMLGFSLSGNTMETRCRKDKKISTGRMLDELKISSTNRSEIKYLLSSNLMDDFPIMKVVILNGLDSFDILPLEGVLANVQSIATEILKVKHLLDPHKNALIIYIPDNIASLNKSKKNIIFDIQPVTGKEWNEEFPSRAINVKDLPKNHPLQIAIFGSKQIS